MYNKKKGKEMKRPALNYEDESFLISFNMNG